MAVKIVTDSTCDIARENVERLGITVVPAYVLFGEESFRQGIDINPTQFYARLQSSPQLPSTSQPTPGDFTEALEPLVSAGDQVVCITVARQLSGTYNSAVQAASQFDDDSITIIDSQTASVGHMLQVIAAAEDASAPDATAESVAAAATQRASTGFGLAMVDTLEYLQKGGRIGKAQAFMGSILKVKPILSVANGEVLPVDRPPQPAPGSAAPRGTDTRAWRVCLQAGRRLHHRRRARRGNAQPPVRPRRSRKHLHHPDRLRHRHPHRPGCGGHIDAPLTSAHSDHVEPDTLSQSLSAFGLNSRKHKACGYNPSHGCRPSRQRTYLARRPAQNPGA